MLFIAYLHSISHNLSLLSRCLNHYRRLLNYVLQALVNKSVNMVKQLYYSEIHSKNIEIYLSMYIRKSDGKMSDCIKSFPLQYVVLLYSNHSWWKDTRELKLKVLSLLPLLHIRPSSVF